MISARMTYRPAHVADIPRAQCWRAIWARQYEPRGTDLDAVTFRVVKRGGRKEMQLPKGVAQPRRTDSTLIKALARAFRWKRMLESGDFATIAELAEREGIALSYITRVLRLTLLAPEIVESILDGKQGPQVTLSRVLEPLSARW